MYKVAVLSLLVVACSALPYSSNIRYGGYGGQQQFLTSQPKIALVGLNSGYGGSSYGSGLGLSSGFLGSGYGSGFSSYGSGLGYGQGLGLGLNQYRTGYLAAAPAVATQFVAAAPAVATIAAAPLASTQLISAAPAISSFGYKQQNLNLLNVRQGQQFQQVVPAAIQQIARTVEYRALANQEQPIQAQVVEVEPSDNPVHLHFKTRSSTLSASQSHIAAPATEVQSAAAQDEPQRLITEVQKPVIQEVREVISPYRQVTQEINPVVESLHTIVTKGEGQRAQYSGASFGAQYQGAAQQQFVAAAPAIASQSYQVQALPAASLQTVAVQPAALQTVAVQAAPAIAVQAAPIALGLQETTSYSAPSTIAVQTPLSSYQYSASAPASYSSFQSSPSFSTFQSKPLSSYSSYSSSSSNGY